jgi:hypothetical protein
MKMFNRTNAVYIVPIEARKAVERKYCRYLEYIQPKCVVEGHESNILGPEGTINFKEAD